MARGLLRRAAPAAGQAPQARRRVCEVPLAGPRVAEQLERTRAKLLLERDQHAQAPAATQVQVLVLRSRVRPGLQGWGFWFPQKALIAGLCAVRLRCAWRHEGLVGLLG